MTGQEVNEPEGGQKGDNTFGGKLCNGFLHLGDSCQAQYSFATMGRAADYRANGGYEAWERSADYVLVPLALIFLAVLLIPLAVHLTPQEQAAFLVANILIWSRSPSTTSSASTSHLLGGAS